MSAFKNRATHEYRHKEDDAIRQELVAAGIPVLTLPAHTGGEVKTKHCGLLNGFEFVRAWRYWECKGDMPLGVAKAIYQQLSELGIRANGHAGNIEPVGYSPEHMAHSKAIVEQMQAQKATTQEIIAELEKVSVAPGTPLFVEMYHIDTAEGLAALADYIKEHNIYAHNGVPGSYTASVFR